MAQSKKQITPVVAIRSLSLLFLLVLALTGSWAKSYAAGGGEPPDVLPARGGASQAGADAERASGLQALEHRFRAQHRFQELIWHLEDQGRFTEAATEKQKLLALMESATPVRSSLGFEAVMQEKAGQMVELAVKHGYNPESPGPLTQATLEGIAGDFGPLGPSFLLMMEGSLVGFRPEMHLFEYANSVRILLKELQTADLHAEVAAYQLDQLYHFSMVPMTISKTMQGMTGIFQYFIKDARWELSFGEAVAQPESQLFDKIKVFDYLTHLADRSPRERNYVMTPEGRLVAIDNLTFREQDRDRGQWFEFVQEFEQNPLRYHLPCPIVERLRNVPEERVRAALCGLASESELRRFVARKARYLSLLDHAER